MRTDQGCRRNACDPDRLHVWQHALRRESAPCFERSRQRAPRANPGRVARLAQRMAGRICVIRCLLLAEDFGITREKSRCCSKSQSKVVAEVVAEACILCGRALSTLPERSSMSFHRIVRHGVVRQGLFPFYEKMLGE